MSVLEIANSVQLNIQAESTAVVDYDDLIKETLESEIDDNIKQEIVGVIEEIIADELNHQMRLGQLYVALTGIEPKGD